MKEEIRGECRKENVKIWGTHECLKQESERGLNFEVENTGNSKKSLLNLMSEVTWSRPRTNYTTLLRFHRVDIIRFDSFIFLIIYCIQVCDPIIENI